MRVAAIGLAGLIFAAPAAIGQARQASADTRIVAAAERGDWPALQGLIKQRVAVDARGADGSTALLWAAYRSNLAVVKALVAAGAGRAPAVNLLVSLAELADVHIEKIGPSTGKLAL